LLKDTKKERIKKRGGEEEGGKKGKRGGRKALFPQRLMSFFPLVVPLQQEIRRTEKEKEGEREKEGKDHHRPRFILVPPIALLITSSRTKSDAGRGKGTKSEGKEKRGGKKRLRPYVLSALIPRLLLYATVAGHPCTRMKGEWERTREKKKTAPSSFSLPPPLC